VGDVVFMQALWCVAYFSERQERNSISSNQILLSDENQQVHMVSCTVTGGKSANNDCFVLTTLHCRR